MPNDLPSGKHVFFRADAQVVHHERFTCGVARVQNDAHVQEPTTVTPQIPRDCVTRLSGCEVRAFGIEGQGLTVTPQVGHLVRHAPMVDVGVQPAPAC